MDKRQAQADGDLTTALCSLPKIQSEDGQDYVQLYDVLETVRRYMPNKKGHWIGVSCNDAFGGDYEAWMSHGDPIAYHYCSECKDEGYLDEDGKEILSDFCPSCGADMRSDGETDG